MAFVFKPVVTSSAGGRKLRRRGRFYWACYTDENGRAWRVPLKLPSGGGITDRAVAQAELRRRLRLMERRAVGLLDPAVESAKLPLRVALARFARYLRGRRRSPKHVRQTIRRVKWLGEHGDIACLGALNSAATERALRVLSGRGRAPKTLNDYRAALFGLCAWAVKVERLIPANPLESVPVQETAGDVRKRRRAFAADEAARLLWAAGPRRLWYETALFTGLRCGELAALRWGDVLLSGKAPSIELRPEATKARRADSIPLRAELAEKLRAARPALGLPTDPVFRTTPTRATFRRDCDRAGVRWEADAQGRSLDRHALRVTFVTWLSRAGVAPRTAQMLARHTDIRLTMRNYTDPGLLDARGAVERLPELPAVSSADVQTARATGTDGPNSVVLPVVLDSCPSLQNGARACAESANATAAQGRTDALLNAKVRGPARPEKSGGGGNRTRVPKHFNLGLYVRSRRI